MEEKLSRKRRVLLVPAPAQGHITPMMQLARILHLNGFSITIAQTKFNYLSPDFQFVTIPENSPESDLEKLGPGRFLIKLAKECCVSFKEWLSQFLIQRQSINEDIACVIYDEFMYFVEEAVEEFKLPNVILSTTSATAFVCRSVMCKLYAKDGLALLKEGGEREEELVPELYPIRYKDLPSSAFATVECSVELFKNTCYKGTASSLIVNTANCLEISSLEWLQRELDIPVYPIGPLHMATLPPPTSLLEENESCIEWLDKQKPSSVMYISLGSMSLMETKEVFEMAFGLVSSNQHFLWVIRPGSIRGSEFSDEELFAKMERSDRGYIVKWAPQKQVLAHPAVGAFWSHCGWNSTLESLGEGVPMICRPFTTDQKGNARYLECVWKVGIQVEGELERRAVERAVKRLMVDDEGHEMKRRALSLKEKLKISASAEEMNNLNEEPSIAPEPNRWYNITLGPSLLSDGHSYNSPRFCTLRYEFKPASIDNTKPGSFRKSNDNNKVTLEFQNNQIGKPKVSFDGVSEDYNDKDKDAILFFDGETFRLEKLHRAVKRLKYQLVPGESAAASITESYSQPVSRAANVVPPIANTVKPVKVAEIDINNPVSLDHEDEEDPYSSAPNPTVYESEEDVNIDDDDNDNDGQQSARKEITSTKEFRTGGLDIDINLPHPGEMEDDEIADVDINDDESFKGLNAAEALRAQVIAEAREERKSSSSSSGRESESSESGAESSGSGSSSSKSRNSGSESGTASH